MSSATVYPNGDGSMLNWETESSSTSNLYAQLDEGVDSPNDADYLRAPNASNYLFLLLQDMPVDFGTITGINIKVRARRVAGIGFRYINGVRIYQSNETTAITASSSSSPLSTSFQNYTFSPSITGATDKSSWDGARLKIDVSQDVEVSAIQVEITYTPTASTYTLTASPGSVAESGVSASLLIGKKLSASAGSVAETGKAATLKKTWRLSAAAGAFAETGNAAASGREMIGERGDFAGSPNAAGMHLGSKLAASPGEFVQSVANAVLFRGQGFPAGPGAFAETGNAASLKTAHKLTSAPGAVSLTGMATGFPPWQHVLISPQGTFSVTGNSVTSLRSLHAGTGVLMLAGRDAGLNPSNPVQSRLLLTRLMNL